MRFTRVSASVKTTSAFYLVLRQTRLIIGLDGFCVFFGIASQCMRFKCVSTSKTAFSFSFVWRYNMSRSMQKPTTLTDVIIS